MCAGCAGSRGKATRVLEHDHILLLALDQPSFLLGRPDSTEPSPGMRATPGHNGLLVGDQGGLFLTGSTFFAGEGGL